MSDQPSLALAAEPKPAPPPTLERQLARHQGQLVGTQIRLLDGELWTFSANLLRGELSDTLAAALDQHFKGEEEDEAEDDVSSGNSRAENSFQVCYLSLKINYPGLSEEALAPILAKDMVPDIVYIANGMAQFKDLVQAAQASAMRAHATSGMSDAVGVAAAAAAADAPIAGIESELAEVDEAAAAAIAAGSAPDPQ